MLTDDRADSSNDSVMYWAKGQHFYGVISTGRRPKLSAVTHLFVNPLMTNDYSNLKKKPHRSDFFSFLLEEEKL